MFKDIRSKILPKGHFVFNLFYGKCISSDIVNMFRRQFLIIIGNYFKKYISTDIVNMFHRLLNDPENAPQ